MNSLLMPIRQAGYTWASFTAYDYTPYGQLYAVNSHHHPAHRQYVRHLICYRIRSTTVNVSELQLDKDLAGLLYYRISL